MGSEMAGGDSPRVRGSLLAKPVRIDPAFEDPHAVLEIIRRGAPYRLLSVVDRAPESSHYDPWFRGFWAVPGREFIEGGDALLHDRRFIEAAKASFGAHVIRPQGILVNLSGPMPAGAAHFDLPFFRGTTPRDYPLELLMAMGSSGLFQRWAIPIASLLAWFYAGPGGAFEYWPEGPHAPAQTERAPLWNVGLVSDNDTMYHRVGEIGRPDEYLARSLLSRSAELHLTDSGDWRVLDAGHVRAAYRFDQVRISILWKAHAFADERAAAALDDPDAQLDPARIASIFMQDLSRRGIGIEEPSDPLGDRDWLAALKEAYPLGGPDVP